MILLLSEKEPSRRIPGVRYELTQLPLTLSLPNPSATVETAPRKAPQYVMKTQPLEVAKQLRKLPE
jgi:hypothetical protein